MKKKLALLLAVLTLAMSVFAACGSKATPAPEEPANEMQYITKEDLKAAIESESNEYIMLDLRKEADYETAHIAGALLASVDSAVQESKDDEGKDNLTAAIFEATGEEKGNEDSKYALICYSGKAYAQKATDLLIELGFNAESIYTLEGGNNGWAEAGDDYKELME